MKWAFSDESRQGNRYCVVAVVIAPHEMKSARQTLEGFLRKNQRRIHMNKESASRRDQFLRLVDELAVDVYAASVATGGRTLGELREIALRSLTPTLLGAGVRSWRLEWIEPHQEHRDRATIAAVLREAPDDTGLVYEHLPPHQEPLLWAADAFAWAILAGRAVEAEVRTLG